MSTKNTLRVSFTVLEKQITQMLRFKAKITPNKTATKTAKKKCFLVFSTKSEKIAIQQSHIINPLLTSFVRSVRESIASCFYRTCRPSSLLRRSVCTKTSGNTFPYRPRNRLISPYYYILNIQLFIRLNTDHVTLNKQLIIRNSYAMFVLRSTVTLLREFGSSTLQQ